jgi:hypothetical protein
VTVVALVVLSIIVTAVYINISINQLIEVTLDELGYFPKQ